MANECNTIYKVTGDINQINDLYTKARNITEKTNSLIAAYDFFSAITNGKVSRNPRCLVYDNFELNNNVLTFSTMSAWCRCNDIEYYIKEEYPLLDVYFSEEVVPNYIKTNDVSSKFFPERYVLYTFHGTFCFTDLDSILSYVSNYFNTEIKSVDALNQITDDEDWICIEVDVIDS